MSESPKLFLWLTDDASIVYSTLISRSTSFISRREVLVNVLNISILSFIISKEFSEFKILGSIINLLIISNWSTLKLVI